MNEPCARCKQLEGALEEMSEGLVTKAVEIAAKASEAQAKHTLRVKTLELEITALRQENKRLSKPKEAGE